MNDPRFTHTVCKLSAFLRCRAIIILRFLKYINFFICVKYVDLASKALENYPELILECDGNDLKEAFHPPAQEPPTRASRRSEYLLTTPLSSYDVIITKSPARQINELNTE